MKPLRILAVFKPLAAGHRADVGPDAPAQGDRDLALLQERLRSARADVLEARATIEAVLATAAAEVRRVATTDAASAAWADLVVSVGGDGTFLRCARHAVHTPLLGVNSAPGTSIGHYCGATAATFAEILDGVLSGREEPTPLGRIGVRLDGRPIDVLALNDVLFCHASPAASTRYLLRVGDDVELQVSSGLWVSTASGSTAGISSAGGDVMEAGDDRLQYLVREPYVGPERRCLLARGYVRDGLTAISRSADNVLFLDGHECRYRVGHAARVEIEGADHPLLAYAYGRRRPA